MNNCISIFIYFWPL